MRNRQTLLQRRKLASAEKRRERAEQAYRATRSHVWLARLRDLTTKCLKLSVSTQRA